VLVYPLLILWERRLSSMPRSTEPYASRHSV